MEGWQTIHWRLASWSNAWCWGISIDIVSVGVVDGVRYWNFQMVPCMTENSVLDSTQVKEHVYGQMVINVLIPYQL